MSAKVRADMGYRYGWLMGLALLTCGCADDAIDVGGEWCGRAVDKARSEIDVTLARHAAGRIHRLGRMPP
jgi:hypothetical protein